MQASALQDSLHQWEQRLDAESTCNSSVSRIRKDCEEGMRTLIVAKRLDGLVSVRLRVETPSFGRLLVGLLRPLERHLILSDDGLAIEDEEWRDLVLFPPVKAHVQVIRKAREAAESWDEGLMARWKVQDLVQVVLSIDSYGAVLELGDIMLPADSVSINTGCLVLEAQSVRCKAIDEGVFVED